MDLNSFDLSQYKAGSTNMMLVKIAYLEKFGFTELNDQTIVRMNLHRLSFLLHLSSVVQQADSGKTYLRIATSKVIL